MTDQEIFNELDKRGIEYSNSMMKKGKDIYQIKIPWSAEAFVDVCNAEGEHLGACCGYISNARDIFTSTLREGGWIRVRDLQEAYENVLACAGSLENFDKANPVKDLFLLYDLIKPVTDKEEPLKKINLSDYEEAVSVVGQMARFLDYSKLFNRRSQKDDKYDNNDLCIAYSRAKLYPALRTMLNHLEKDDKEYEGFAVIDEDESFLETRVGPAIYKDLETIDECFEKVWGEEIREQYSVKKIILSPKNGIVFKEIKKGS